MSGKFQFRAAFALACTAVACPAVKESIFRHEGVPASAAGSKGCRTGGVFCTGNGFQVSGIHAGEIPAQVVEFHPAWEWSHKYMVGKAVGKHHPLRGMLTRIGSSVTVFIDEACPVPAPVNEATGLINAVPEQELKRLHQLPVGLTCAVCIEAIPAAVCWLRPAGHEFYTTSRAGLRERHSFLQRTSPVVVGDGGAGDTVFGPGNYSGPNPHWEGSMNRAQGSTKGSPLVGKRGRS